MSSDSPLDRWKFLIGHWKGTANDEFGEEGAVERSHVFSAELGERFITGKHEAWNAGKLVHKAASFLYYDPRIGRFRRKDVYSYGFVNNEVEYKRTDDEIKFEVVVEPSAKQFEGVRWRSYIRKISDNKIVMGQNGLKEKGNLSCLVKR